MKRNIALILAGGTGQRLGNPLPKQYIEVEGRPIIAETLSAFEQHASVTDIVVVCQCEWMSFVEEIARKFRITKFRACLEGGATGFDSLISGVKGLPDMLGGLDEDAVVLVHDSVRPLVTQTIVGDNIAMCRTKGNAITGYAINEALLQIEADGVKGRDYTSRDRFRLAQTPHTFFLTDLRQMVDQAEKEGLQDVQSACVLAVKTKHVPLHAVPGSLYNFKITVLEDLDIYRALLSQKLL